MKHSFPMLVAIALLSACASAPEKTESEKDTMAAAKETAERIFLIEVAPQGPSEKAIAKKLSLEIEQHFHDKAYAYSNREGNESFKMAPVEAQPEAGTEMVCRFPKPARLRQFTQKASPQKMVVTLLPRAKDGRRKFEVVLHKQEAGKWIAHENAGEFRVPNDADWEAGVTVATDDDFLSAVRETLLRLAIK